jgi:hypothetical protein
VGENGGSVGEEDWAARAFIVFVSKDVKAAGKCEAVFFFDSALPHKAKLTKITSHGKE